MGKYVMLYFLLLIHLFSNAEMIGDGKKRDDLRSLLRHLPKPQLHLHMDGSLSVPFIRRSIARIKRDRPAVKLFPDGVESLSDDAMSNMLWTMKEKQRSKGDNVTSNANWRIFDFTNQFLQTREDLRDATMDIVTQMNEHYGVDYIEIRFAPVLHTSTGLREKEIVKIVTDAYDEAKANLAKKGVVVSGGIIICALRSFPVDAALKTVQLVADSKALAFDIAGFEGGYPLSLFASALTKAQTLGVDMTLHAGEWPSTKFPEILNNLELAVKSGVKRIGHGLMLVHSAPTLITELNKRDVGVEVCLTSNCGALEKCKDYSVHPIKWMFSQKIKVAGLNVDNTLLSGNRQIGRPDPVEECVHALLDVQITPEQLIEAIAGGYKSTFVPVNDVDSRLVAWKQIIPKIKAIVTS